MPEDITIIQRLELDNSGYIAGVEGAATSLTLLIDKQKVLKERLDQVQIAYKASADSIALTRKKLDEYTGSNEAYRKQEEKAIKQAESEQKKLNELLEQTKKEYDEVTKAVNDFSEASKRATTVQAGTTGARIPTTPTPLTPPEVPTPPGGQPAPPIAPEAQTIEQKIKVIVEDADLVELQQLLKDEAQDFENLRTTVAQVEEAMKTMDAGSEEFERLALFVEAGKDALAKYDGVTTQVTERVRGFRAQITELQNRMTALAQAGKENTEEYKDLEIQVTRLTKAYNDQRERIKILASETRGLDFGKAAITAATNVFQAFTAVQILAGDESEELQKKTMHLFATMQLLTAIEGTYNALKKNGVLLTNLQSAAQAAYTFAVSASTAALRAMRVAMLATGVGAAIVGIALLVKKYQDHAAAIKKVKEEQEFYNGIVEEARKASIDQITHLELIRIKLNDLSIPQVKRIELAKEYNKTADESNKIDIAQIDNIDLLNKAIDEQIKQIDRRAKAKAAENAITKQYEKVFDEQEKAIERAEKAADKFLSTTIDRTQQTKAVIDQTVRKQTIIEPTLPTVTTTTPELTPAEKEELTKASKESSEKRKQFIDTFIETDPKLKQANDELKNKLRVALGFIDIESLLTTTTPGKTTPTGKIQNEFEKRKAELDKRLRELLRGEIDTIEKIRDEFKDKLIEAEKDIETALSAGKLLPRQAEILKAEAKTINTIELEKAIADFQKKVLDARKKIDDEIEALQEKNIQDNLNLLQDEFNRRAQLIDFNEKQELENSKENIEKRIEALDLQRLLIGEEEYQNAKAELITNGEQAAINIIKKYAQDREKLAADIYKRSLDAYKEAIFQGDLVRNEAAAKELRLASDKFLGGAITWEEYQREITAIQKKYEAIRRDATLATQRIELADLEARLAGIKDRYSTEFKDIEKLILDLRAKIASGEAADAAGDAGDLKAQQDEADARVDARNKKILEYVSAIGALTESVIAFWQRANEAEAAALDRSIALQERRVDAARRIAERGNAEYLQQEEDRLRELEIQRENAARRQLAIDAALQASQILVGITGAIAKISTGIGAAQTIAEIAIIVGALATGYGLVKSLQGNQPKLYKGTPYLKRDKGEPAGKDTIPAWLNEGEAVIPTEKNKKYEKAVNAIYYGKVPAEVLNKFVENYVREKTIIKKDIIQTKNQNQVFRNDKAVHLSNKERETVRDTTNTNLEIYKNFVSNISKVPEKEISRFIKDYESNIQKSDKIEKITGKTVIQKLIEKYEREASSTEKATNELIKEKTFKEKLDSIPQSVLQSFISNYQISHNEKIPSSVLNNFINNYKTSTPAEKVNSFVKTYHTIKPLPVPNFQRIKEATETKIGYDGKIASILSEQNRMLAENNDLQRATIRALRSMGVNVNLDKDGFALSVMEVMEKIEIDKRV